MSDVMDDNELSAIACLCPIRAELLIPDLDAWLQADENLVYQSKYVPTEGVFRKLTEDEQREAKVSRYIYMCVCLYIYVYVYVCI